MTTVSGTGTPAVHAARPKRKLPRAMILVGLGVILLSIVRVVADADDLTSAGSFSAAIRIGTPSRMAARSAG